MNDDSNEDEKIGREDFATPREEEWSGLFAKVYLQAFCAAADSMIQSQKLRIFLYLLANTNPGTNTVRASYDDINRACGTSAKTVSKLLKGAQAAGILKRIKGSEYMINPKYMCYGRDG